mmetsp:Transcript_6695/g.18011  ORF Transcript_6695/g.18011 Transcript_6695/m.18011 type:complete len:440 (-) Transcript_6695:13-1332(-)
MDAAMVATAQPAPTAAKERRRFSWLPAWLRGSNSLAASPSVKATYAKSEPPPKTDATSSVQLHDLSRAQRPASTPDLTGQSAPPEPRPCSSSCGWNAFPGFPTCCRSCAGPEGPHAKDCAVKNKRAQLLCERGCGRLAFASFATCCTRCTGPDGGHARACAAKGGPWQGAGNAGDAGDAVAATTPLEVEERLRARLEEWHAAGAMGTPEESDGVIQTLAQQAGMQPQGGPKHAYVGLAKEFHAVDVEVVDLGQYSAEHSNSCMFLTCATMLADRRLQGHADAQLPGVLGVLLEASAPPGALEEGLLAIDDLIAQHNRGRGGTLGHMADALRHAACEVLLHDMDYYLPFYHPVGRGEAPEPTPEGFKRWVEQLRGDEEGDELVILALSRLCGMAVQPVSRGGYRVPLMDPTGAAQAGCVTYWGNDDRHWVWLRAKQEEAR